MSLFKKPEEEIVAVFDIGNGSIGGALVKLNRHGLPILLYAHREPLAFLTRPTSKTLFATMVKTLKSISDHLAKDGLAHIKTSVFGGHRLRDAYCIFSSPWYISQTKIIREEWEKPRTISQDSIDELVKKEQDQFNKDLKEGKYEQILGPDTRLLEKRIINVRLNGYTIPEPIGKQARQLELTLFTSYVSQEILKKVEETLHSSFAVRSISHYSYGLVSWSSSQVLSPDIHDCFFMDISGETTDVSLVVKDVLIETVSFPMGRSSLLRKVIRDLSVEPDIALSFLTMYFNNTLNAAFKKKIESILEPIGNDWHDALVVALQKFQKVYSLPRATFVTSDLDTSGFFLQALTKEFPAELNLAKNTLSVMYIGADKVQSFIEVLPTVTQDSFIAIESIFLNKIFSLRK